MISKPPRVMNRTDERGVNRVAAAPSWRLVWPCVLRCALVLVLIAPAVTALSVSPVLPVSTDAESADDGPVAGAGAAGGLAGALTPQADSPADRFAQAVEAYRQRDHAQALTLFADLAAEETDNTRRALLHFDAGTAAARAGASGEAVWHLDAALRFDPDLSVATVNLRQVQAELGTTEETEETQFTSALKRLPLRWTPRVTRRIVAGLLALGLLLLALWRAGPGGRGAALAGVVCLFLAGGWHLASDLARALDRERAVVVAERVAVRSEPADGAEVLGRLQQGTEVRHDDERRGWRLVETAQGARGWVLVDEVRPVAQ